MDMSDSPKRYWMSVVDRDAPLPVSHEAENGDPNFATTRRSFLKVGTFAFGATTFNLADVLRAEAAQSRSAASQKAVINVFLGGGPPHQDMWEIKTEAPSEIRGEFRPIA